MFKIDIQNITFCFTLSLHKLENIDLDGLLNTTIGRNVK